MGCVPALVDLASFCISYLDGLFALMVGAGLFRYPITSRAPAPLVRDPTTESDLPTCLEYFSRFSFCLGVCYLSTCCSFLRRDDGRGSAERGRLEVAVDADVYSQTRLERIVCPTALGRVIERLGLMLVVTPTGPTSFQVVPTA